MPRLNGDDVSSAKETNQQPQQTDNAEKTSTSNIIFYFFLKIRILDNKF